MDGSRFDQLARAMGRQGTRRGLLKGLGAAALGGLSLARAGGAAADNACKPAAPATQAKCSKDAQCCAGLICQGGTCQGGCRIGGGYYAAGTINSSNVCRTCQPAVSTTAWSPVANGTGCSDNNACTNTDTCQA